MISELLVLTISLVPVIAVLCLVGGFEVLRENERIVILRSGRFFRVIGPGPVWLMPFISHRVRIFLPEEVPEWESLSKEELEKRLAEQVLERVAISEKGVWK